MPTSPPEPVLEVLYEDEGARVTRRPVRGFLYHQILGRVTPGLVSRLRRLISQRPRGHVAVETADLAGANAPFLGQLRVIAREVEQRGDIFVLVRPGERVRDLLALGGAEGAIRILASLEELSGDVGALDARARRIREVADEVARESGAAELWRLRDGAGGWLCPLCAVLVPGVRVPEAGEWSRAALEAAAAHLLDACTAWAAGVRIPRPATELRARIAAAGALQREHTRLHTRRLESEVVALRAQAERSAAIDADLAKARDRQRRLLRAAPPDAPGLGFGLLYRPADRVGGDFYDFVPLGPGRFGLLVGDVSGHGIEGAILMGMAKKVCALRLAESGDPAEALRRANEDLRPDLDGVTFVTALAAVVDLPARRLTLARAGHNPALLVNPARDPTVRELDPPGMVLGMADAKRFDALLSVAHADLADGDLILIYSDGITECENPLGMEFGTERLSDFCQRGGDCSPQALLEALQQRLVDFQGGEDRRGDDCTAIALRLA